MCALKAVEMLMFARFRGSTSIYKHISARYLFTYYEAFSIKYFCANQKNIEAL